MPARRVDDKHLTVEVKKHIEGGIASHHDTFCYHIKITLQALSEAA
jgi:hypothetical protein